MARTMRAWPGVPENRIPTDDTPGLSKICPVASTRNHMIPLMITPPQMTKPASVSVDPAQTASQIAF